MTTQGTKQLKSPGKTKIGGNIVERDKEGKFVRGHKKIGGKELGNKSFSTLMDTAVKEIAKINKISTAEVWQVLIKRGYSEAKDGNYMFYKDLMDRYYGKAKDLLDVTSKGESLIVYLPNKNGVETK